MQAEIKDRHSVRTYQKVDLSTEHQAQVQEIINNTNSLYGTKVRLQVHKNNTENLKISSYGVIKNPAYCITVIHNNSEHAYVDAGYVLANVVLQLTKLGIGTCILGGTFRAKDFNQLAIGEDERLSIVISLGYPLAKKTVRDKMITRLAKAHTRLDYQQLFFDHNLNPLTKSIEQLEQVRLAPSALNLQPWRVIKAIDGYEFYIDISKKPVKAKDLRLIDLGIAIAHLTYNEEFTIEKIEQIRSNKLHPIAKIILK